MNLHPSAFDFHQPTPEQINKLKAAREAAKIYAAMLDGILPEGDDKVRILQELRSLAMWVNVCLTRHSDGTPRD